MRARPWDAWLIVVGVVLIQFLPTHIIGDGQARYVELQHIAHGQSMAGAPLPVWGAAFSLPLYAIGTVIGHPALVTGHYNGLLIAALIGALALTLRDAVDRRTLTAFFLLLLAGSMLAAHAEEFYGEVFTLLTVGTGLAIVVLRPRRAAWALVILGVANTPASVVALALVVGVYALQRRRLRYALVVIGAALLIVGDNVVRHTSLLTGSYSHAHIGSAGSDEGFTTILPYSGKPGFSYPFPLGIGDILFSFGKGVLFFVPGAWVVGATAVRRRLSPPASRVLLLWALFTLGLVVLYSSWWGWDGGIFWGPRFFLFAVLPASLALATLVAHPPARVRARAGVLGLLVASVYVAVDGASLQTNRVLQLCAANNYSQGFLCSYAPEYSPLWRPLLDPLHLTVAQWVFAAWAVGVGVFLGAPLAASLWRDACAAVRRLEPVGRWGW